MRKIIIKIILFSLIIPFINLAQELTKYVDPMIGTGGFGHTFPGAVVPFGMVQLSPDTDIEGWDWCSGYHYSDNSIMGFSHTHLSGTGAADYGDVLLMPTTGELKIIPGSKENPDEGYRSRFSHENEEASPGYYKVLLEDYNITVELTATARGGFHKYTFPKSDVSNIIIDLKHGISDKTTDAFIRFTGENKLEGYRRSQGWASDQIIYFAIEFSKSFEKYGTVLNDEILESNKEAKGENVKGYVVYKTKEGEEVFVKVGISAVSIEGAKKNLEAEIQDWNFDKIRKAANDAWEKDLSKIKVEGGSTEQKTNFYTALYHSMIHPNIFMDVDGKYRGMDQKIYKAKDFNYYTVYSLWDTYRALHPLFTIIEPERDADMIKTLISKYERVGILPVWELWSNETATMIGYHSIPVIVDAYMKGIRNFNVEKAYEAMKHSAEMDHLGLKSYKELNYVASDREHEAVSKTLEYAYDDWCIAMMAKDLGKEDDYKKYSKRAMNYRNLFDGQSGFMRGKNADGKWGALFNPFSVTRDFTEANSWQYSLYVPQDVEGMKSLYGSGKNLVKKLDETFTAESKLEGKKLVDISGLIGQYAHGNEPSHHMAYLYNFTSEPWKTQERVRYILDNMYNNTPDGLIGNEDCGQMSAWYVLSAMGFYSVTPGTNQYVIGTPLFDKVTIDLGNGKEFVAIANRVSNKNIFIQSVELNGQSYNKNYINYEDIKNGSKVIFEMSSKPNKSWGIKKEDQPYSFSEVDFVSPPYQKNDITYFEESAEVDLFSRTEGAEIRFTVDGSEPNQKSTLFTEPFKITSSILIKAKAFKEGMDSSVVSFIEANKLKYLAPVVLENAVNGIDYEYYEGNFLSVFDFASLSPLKTGTLKNFDLTLAEKEDHYGFKFTGYIKIPAKGSYQFYTLSDDGSVLYIDGKQVVGNDGSHAALEATGIIALKEGYHSFTLLYFEDYEGQEINVMFEGKGIEKQPISASMLYRENK
ncbi:MAG: GH92 family glycosyl hydrolase [Bacteroidetes bacterium]|nr:GH92 family glycosyl hydrolase [Bacteroidota bacterium]MBU1113601.1 GH92 family glycosyl hydrolase [Bacteroidota bacterium]MBU1796977.1 GH92 family glycosyl hydrolase [Bacteroidota bacterium]